LRSAANWLEAERAELDAILASGILGRTNYVVKLLTFVSEKYFEGDVEDIKEYSIAVHALGRSPDFDPQADTIVRVTAHTLRKRLEEYYRTDGADHAIHICLPPGHYVPNFARKSASVCEENEHAPQAEGSPSAPTSAHTTFQQERKNGSVPAAVEPPPLLPNAVPVQAALDAAKSRRLATTAAVLLIAACLALAGFYLWPRTGRASYGETRTAAAAPLAGPSSTFRSIVGDGREPYTDQSGFLWNADSYCSGGDSFSVPKTSILGTDDPQLFLGGRHGMFHCSFPLPPGSYEVHLMFAETAGLQENTRNVGFSVNGGPENSLDVVDDAGADDTATTKVFTNVTPKPDGDIHVDFVTSDSFLNAVEILPDPTPKALPIRIIAGRTAAYRDRTGDLWLPDRDYFGGRPSNLGNDVSNLPEAGVYSGQRIGHFHYSIPVPTGEQYTVKLHFVERWFGIQNQNVGGVGSRVFDVSCNGQVLLRNFDIMREAQGTPLVKTFMHIEPTPQGKIELYFTPGVNYPMVNAIEIIPE
jgi:hypothetical protein